MAAVVLMLLGVQVRVSRQRILESAMKVMSLYAGGRAVLELEYFGEAGTGLGPTLEFFTLLSHELQRKGLGMWRSDHSGTACHLQVFSMPAQQRFVHTWHTASSTMKSSVLSLSLCAHQVAGCTLTEHQHTVAGLTNVTAQMAA